MSGLDTPPQPLQAGITHRVRDLLVHARVSVHPAIVAARRAAQEVLASL